MNKAGKVSWGPGYGKLGTTKPKSLHTIPSRQERALEYPNTKLKIQKEKKRERPLSKGETYLVVLWEDHSGGQCVTSVCRTDWQTQAPWPRENHVLPEAHEPALRFPLAEAETENHQLQSGEIQRPASWSPGLRGQTWERTPFISLPTDPYPKAA